MSEVNESTATKAAFHMVMLQNTQKKLLCSLQQDQEEQCAEATVGSSALKMQCSARAIQCHKSIVSEGRSSTPRWIERQPVCQSVSTSCLVVCASITYHRCLNLATWELWTGSAVESEEWCSEISEKERERVKGQKESAQVKTNNTESSYHWHKKTTAITKLFYQVK